jgi:hypothetical protein
MRCSVCRSREFVSLAREINRGADRAVRLVFRMHYHPGQELSNIETKVLLKTHLLFSIRMHASSRHSVARHSIACTLETISKR